MTEFSTGLAEGADGSTAGADAAATALERLDADAVDFCQVFGSSRYDQRDVLEGVESVVDESATVIGCASTTEFTQEDVVEAGVAVTLVASDAISFSVGLGEGLSENVVGTVRDAVETLPLEDREHPYRSAIVLHDGLSSVGEHLTMVIQRKLGPDVSFVGGAASDNFEMESTPVYCDGRVVEDGIVVAVLDSERPPSISIDHGHEPVSEPVTVTDAEGPVVNELDGRPAYDVWRDTVADDVWDEFEVDLYEQPPKTPIVRRILGEFEFGIDQGEKYKLRSPGIGSVEAGSLTFPVDVPEGTVFRIMHGGRTDQVASARRTARQAVEGTEGEGAGAFVYDCACRGTILGDEFPRAVDALNEEFDVPFAGFETYGEVCMQTGELSGFHNTTTVAVILPD